MKRKRIRSIQAGWVALLAVLLFGLTITPASAMHSTSVQRLNPTTSVNATIYVTLDTLEPIFQSRLNQQVPTSVANAIAGIVSKLPKQDQGWAQQMATTLIQPSASLTSLTTQQGGLATSLRVNLYPGDPQPIHASMLISFSVLNSSTVQVSVTPLSGSPALINGPLTTFQVPFGQLNRISTTPTCGKSTLAVNLQFPIALGQGQATSQAQQNVLQASVSGSKTQSFLNQTNAPTERSIPANTNSYVEIPASSLASLGNSIGSLPVSRSLTAENIQISVQGSNLLITSDIYNSFWGKIGSAQTTVTPTASGGNLAVHVLSTTLKLFGLFSFPYNSYNQQIEQTLNAKLNGALKGKFNVLNAAIGPNVAVPCAAGDSLVLTGTTYLG